MSLTVNFVISCTICVKKGMFLVWLPKENFKLTQVWRFPPVHEAKWCVGIITNWKFSLHPIQVSLRGLLGSLPPPSSIHKPLVLYFQGANELYLIHSNSFARNFPETVLCLFPSTFFQWTWFTPLQCRSETSISNQLMLVNQFLDPNINTWLLQPWQAHFFISR